MDGASALIFLYSWFLIPVFICLSAALPCSPSPLTATQTLASHWSMEPSGQSGLHASPPISLLTHNTRLGNFILPTLLFIPMNIKEHADRRKDSILIFESQKTLIWIWHFYLIEDVGIRFFQGLKIKLFLPLKAREMKGAVEASPWLIMIFRQTLHELNAKRV